MFFKPSDTLAKHGKRLRLKLFVSAGSIPEFFLKYGNLQNPPDDVYAINDSVLDEICRALENLNLSKSMEVEEFLTVPEEDVVYEISDDDQIITELARIWMMQMIVQK